MTGMAVMTTAFRRPHYLQRTLRAWAAADGIGDVTRFLIALAPSDRHDRNLVVIKALRPQFACPVDLEIQSEAAQRGPSAHRAIAEAVTALFTDPAVDFAVAGEEDVLVSSDVLAYMSWAREKFASDERVLCVLAHNKGGQGWDGHVMIEDEGADQEAVRLLPYFNPWCWGTWRDRWEQVLEPQWDYDCNSGGPDTSGYDWAIQTKIIPRGDYLCVVPDASRSQNIGRFEGGYSSPALFPFTQSKSFREVRECPAYRLEG